MTSSEASLNITNTKSTFLGTQIRLLSTPLRAPSPPPLSTSPSLPATTVSGVIDKINKKITSHNRLAFSLESRRHVAEQIDSLYWRDVLSQGLPVKKSETVVPRERDLAQQTTSLPAEWEDVLVTQRPSKRRRLEEEEEAGRSDARSATVDQQQKNRHEAEQKEQYTALRHTLQTQHVRLAQLRRKHAHLQKLQSLLKPFENPQDHIQPNLVTRDNKELQDELSRLRVLLVRVGSAVQARETVTVDEGEGEKDGKSRDLTRLEDVLGLG